MQSQQFENESACRLIENKGPLGSRTATKNKSGKGKGMKSQKKNWKLLLAVLFFTAIALTPAAMATEIRTNQEDYGPDEVVYISGSGFDISSVITVTIVGPEEWGTDQFDSLNSPWWVYWSFEEPDKFNIAYLKTKCLGTFTVTATDGTNTATTTFTDGVTSVSVGSQVGTLTQGTAGSVTYPVTVAWSGGGGPYTLAISGLPVGASGTFDPASVDSSLTSTLTVSTSSAVVAGSYTFTVQLHSKTADGTLTIDAAPVNVPPTAEANGPYDVDEGDSVTLSSAGSSDSDGSIVSYEWDFDYDGITFDVDATGQSPSFSAAAIVGPASRTVALRVTDDDGGSDIDTATVNILVPVEEASVIFDQTGVGGGFLGVVVTIDGVNYGVGDLPVTITKEVDDTISFEYYSPLLVDGTQYVWTTTSGLSAAQSATINVPSGGGSVTGNYGTQYYLTVTSPYGLPVTGEGWYDAGDLAYAGLTSDVESGGAGIQYVFDSWSGDASGSDYLASNAITMNGPKEAIAVWTTQYYLMVLTDPAEVLTLNPAAVSGEGWYDADEIATVDALQNVDKAAGERYDFRSWTGATPTGTGNEAAVLMDGPKIVTANYQLQYELTLVTNPAAVTIPAGAGWYDAEDDASISTDENVDIVAGESRYHFTGWTTDDMTEIDDPSAASTTVYMDKAKTVTTNYVTQYHVTFDQTGLNGTATGLVATYEVDSLGPVTLDFPNFPEGLWVDEGETVTYAYEILVASTTPGYQFWLSSVTGPASPVTVDGAVSITGNYTELPKSAVTSSSLCPFDVDPALDGEQFRLIFTQDPTNVSTFKLTASNPGQFYYNVFYVGTPGDTANLTIDVPYPFVTQGAMPVHVYASVSLNGECFIPANEIAAFNAQSGNNPHYAINVTVPDTGLVYVAIHLDYGLKKTIGYSPYGNNAVSGTNRVDDLTDYDFIVGGDMDDVRTVQNQNVFKKIPGFGGLVLDEVDTPIPGANVTITGPGVTATVLTDVDGFYYYYYKHKGKDATFTVSCSGQSTTVVMKANKFVEVNFVVP